jgi:phosphoribosylaminoimidazolecarboxamide formyltransferase/IMP cyclohydrolase
MTKTIKSALISVFHKDRIDEICRELAAINAKVYSTGGTYDYIENLNIENLELLKVEDLTDYPSILGGRVKTLHPKVFGGILSRRELESDQKEMQEYQIPEIDLVVVDLYPFEQTLASGAQEQAIIEKIDIGGISLIRAAAKNFKDVAIVPSANEYDELIRILKEQKGETGIEDRKALAAKAFAVSSHYDSAIFGYFNQDSNIPAFRESHNQPNVLRYGENPHQKGVFYGNLDEVFEQLHGKAISYNNIIDIDAAIALISEFDEEPTFAVLKHNNACGLASRSSLKEAWDAALAGDPLSAYGGVLIANKTIDEATAEAVNKIFFEIILAPDYDEKALEILKSKKNRIILKKKPYDFAPMQYRKVLNGVLCQDKDMKQESEADLQIATKTAPDKRQTADLLFANKIVKHTKSNAIVLVNNKQLIGSGTGQTSRVDALKHAIEKARNFELNLEGAVMASDAFFPFADSVEIAHKAGVNAVVQPGGSIRDKDSIAYCDENQMAMVLTGIRHFKH